MQGVHLSAGCCLRTGRSASRKGKSCMQALLPISHLDRVLQYTGRQQHPSSAFCIESHDTCSLCNTYSLICYRVYSSCTCLAFPSSPSDRSQHLHCDQVACVPGQEEDGAPEEFTFVQCCKCKKWRRLRMPAVAMADWECTGNPDIMYSPLFTGQYRRFANTKCSIWTVVQVT